MLVISVLLAGNVQLNPGPALLSRNQPALDSASSLNVRMVPTPSDGHCFFHALHVSIATYVGVHMPYKMVRDFLADEINSHIDAYASFSSSSLSSFKEKIPCYFQLKSYNKDFCDMLPLVAANAFSIRIIIFSSPAQPINQCIIVNHLTSSLAALTILRIS